VDIYNFDKTGFQMGVISTAKVITASERTLRPVTIQPGNREWVTAIECINSYGWSLPPIIILKGKIHISSWYTDLLPSDWTIAVSENSWTTDQLGLTWLTDVFEKYTKDRTDGVYRLLILDGETPYNIQELEFQAKAIGDFVRRRIAGSSSPTDYTIQQLVKGCQMAMHSAVLLADENKKLRATNKRQKKKRAVRRSYIATGGVLTV
jgi:hypothetical protein